MANNSIGNASLNLSASGGDLVQGLHSTSAGIKSWADKTKSTLNGALKVGGAGAAGGVAGGVLGGLKGSLVGIGAGIGTLFGPLGTVIGGAIGGTISTIAGAVMEPFDKLKQFAGIVKQATTLGVDASELQGMQQLLHKVGVEAEDSAQVFAVMGKNIVNSSPSVQAALNAMDVDMAKLADASLTDQFKMIADGINNLKPGASQAAAAMAVFGKSGASLLPMLQRGGQGIDEFIAKQKGVGAILSTEQLKAAADAAKAWKESRDRISAVWDGLVNRATLIAAPIIKFIGGVVSKAFALLSPVFEWLGRVIGQVAVILEAVFEVLSGWFDEAVKWFTELIGEVQGFTGEWPKVEDVVTAVLKGMAMGLGYVWDTLKAGVGIGAYVIGFLVEGFGKLVQRFKDTVKDLLEIAGELPDSLGGDFFRKAAGNVDKLGGKIAETGAAMQKWGKDQMNAWGDSPVKIGAWFDRLKNKKKEEEKKEEKKAGEIPKPEYKTVQAALRGSKEAYEIEARYKFGDVGKKVDEKQLDEAKKGNGLLSTILDAFRAAPVLKAG